MELASGSVSSSLILQMTADESVDGDPLQRANDVEVERIQDSDASVPPYTSSSPTPTYSFNPRPDEHRLALSSSSRHHRMAGPSIYTITDKASGFTLDLVHQGEKANEPCYGRHAIVRGRVLTTRVESLDRIDLEVRSHRNSLNVG